MTDTFTTALSWLRKFEGGWSNDRNDRGGMTNFGISAAFLQGLQPHLSREVIEQQVRAMTWERASELYHRHFWLANACDRMQNAAALVTFDWAVNGGSKGARHLQEVAGVTADGKVGPITLRAVNALEPLDLVWRYQARRNRWYFNRALDDPSQRVFIGGWLNRTEKLTCLVIHYVREEIGYVGR